MSDALNRMDELERELNAALADVGDRLDASLAPAVLERVKSAVRCELDETWLAEHPTPKPARPVLASVRSAMRRELERSDVPAIASNASRSRAWPQGIASLAAAAMVAVCVGLIRQAGYDKPASTGMPSPSIHAADAPVELFAQAAEDVLGGDDFTNSILTELSAIEAQMAGWRATGDEGERGLQEIERALDELLNESDAPGDPVGLGGRHEDGVG